MGANLQTKYREGSQLQGTRLVQAASSLKGKWSILSTCHVLPELRICTKGLGADI